jgi:hypothetical protein
MLTIPGGSLKRLSRMPFLKIGEIFASLHIKGTYFSDNDRLYRIDSGVHKPAAHSLSTIGRIPSGPQDLPLCSLCSFVLTFSTVKSILSMEQVFVGTERKRRRSLVVVHCEDAVEVFVQQIRYLTWISNT